MFGYKSKVLGETCGSLSIKYGTVRLTACLHSRHEWTFNFVLGPSIYCLLGAQPVVCTMMHTEVIGLIKPETLGQASKGRLWCHAHISWVIKQSASERSEAWLKFVFR